MKYRMHVVNCRIHYLKKRLYKKPSSLHNPLSIFIVSYYRSEMQFDNLLLTKRETYSSKTETMDRLSGFLKETSTTRFSN